MATGQDVAAALAPGRVVHFGHDGFHVSVIAIETIVEAHGVEAVTEVAQMGEQPDRARGTLPPGILHQVTNRLLERGLRITEMILPAETGRRDAACRPEPALAEHRLHFVQVEVHHEQPVAELVTHGPAAAVPNSPFEDRAVHESALN